MLNMYALRKEWGYFCLSGPSWGASWGPLGASWGLSGAVVGPSSASSSNNSETLGLRGPFGRLLRPSGAVSGLSWAVSGRPQRPRHPHALSGPPPRAPGPRARLFELPSARDGRRGLQDGPATAQEGLQITQEASKMTSKQRKRAPGGPRTDAKRPQAGPKEFPEGTKTA